VDNLIVQQAKCQNRNSNYFENSICALITITIWLQFFSQTTLQPSFCRPPSY